MLCLFLISRFLCLRRLFFRVTQYIAKRVKNLSGSISSQESLALSCISHEYARSFLECLKPSPRSDNTLRTNRARVCCLGDARFTREHRSKERERKEAFTLRASRRIEHRPVALLLRTHHNMRARSRASRRDTEASGRRVASEIPRETYLHFNKRYYWMLRRGTTCSVVSPSA